MKKTLTLFLLLFFVQLTLFAQNKFLLSGKVHLQNGVPVNMVLVSVEGSTIGYYTDNNGKYSLELKSGKYTIVVSLLGYETIKKSLNLQKETTLNFILKEDVLLLKGVEVKGKSKSRKLQESAFTVNAIDVSPLIDNANNLNSIIGRSNGIKLRDKGGLGADVELSINGLSGNSIRYFVDGIPLSSMGAALNLSNLPINIIERVEIYKGVVPAKLGADALGGAINIVTKKNKNNYIDASFGAGSFNTYKADFNSQLIQKNTGLILKPSFAYSYSKNNFEMRDVEVWDEKTREFTRRDINRFHNDYASLLGQLDVGVIDKSWCDSFFLSLSYSKIDKELQTGSTQNIVYGKAERKNESFKLSARYKKRNFLFKKLSANIFLSHTRNSKKVIDTVYRKYNWLGTYINSSRSEISGRGKSIRNIKRPLTIVRSNFNYPINNNHSLNLNYMLQHIDNERYDDFDTDFVPSSDAFAKNIIGLSYAQKLFNSKLNNSFFFKDYISRLEVNQSDLSWITGAEDKAGATITNNYGYGFGSRYVFFDFLSIKTSYEHSVRLPLSRELLGNGTTVYPNFNLKPESGDNYNIGIFGDFDITENHNLTYETNFFVRKAQDYIHLVISEMEGLSQYDNVSNVLIKGVEGELRYDYKSFIQLKANCSFLDERSDTKYQANGKPEITYNNRMPNRPWLYSNLEFNMHMKDLFGNRGTQLRFGYDFQYVHWFYLTWAGYGSLKSKSKIPTQYISNANLSYAFKDGMYNISLECKNLFDKTVYDNYMLQKPGRSFFCKLRIFISKF